MITGSFKAQNPAYVLNGNGAGFVATQSVRLALTGDGSSTTFQFDFANINSSSLQLGTPSLPVISLTPQQVGGLPKKYQSATAYPLNQVVIDSNGLLQQVTTAGTSAGILLVPGLSYTVGQTVIDPAGNWQICLVAGTTSLATTFIVNQLVGSTLQDGTVMWDCVTPIYPAFSKTTGITTADGTVVWTCLGANIVVPQYDSPTATGTFLGTVLTVTFSEALKVPGTVVKDTYGNSYTIQVWAANTVVTFASVATSEPIPQTTALGSTAKSVQGSSAVPTQDMKDGSRIVMLFSATGVAAGATATETLLSMTQSLNGVNTTGTSFVITANKNYRITQIMFGCRGNATATAQITTFSFRFNPTGAITTSSTVSMAVRTMTPATAFAVDRVILSIPDGIEFTSTSGTVQIGITSNSVYVTNAPTLDVFIYGFEY